MKNYIIVASLVLSICSLSYAADAYQKNEYVAEEMKEQVPSPTNGTSLHHTGLSNATPWTTIELDHVNNPQASGEKMFKIYIKELGKDTAYALATYNLTNNYGHISALHVADAWKDIPSITLTLRKAIGKAMDKAFALIPSTSSTC